MQTAVVRVLIMLVALGLTVGCTPRNPGPRAEWLDQEADLGPIKQGTEVEHAFNFTNVGMQPLLVREVKPSCGCTSVDWPRHPIGPGEKGVVRVRYKAGLRITGEELKHVTVLANTKPDFTHLYLKATVVL